MGFSRDEVAELVSAFGSLDQVSALELNVSCPNVETGLVMGADPLEVSRLLERVRPLTAKPLIVKLTPNASDVAAVARAAQEAGASAVSLINTLRGMALDPASGRPWLGGGPVACPGRPSEPWLSPRCTQWRKRCGFRCSAWAGWGAARTHLTCCCGASLVAVGTENFRDPAAGLRVTNELLELLPSSSFSGASTVGAPRLNSSVT